MLLHSSSDELKERHRTTPSANLPRSLASWLEWLRRSDGVLQTVVVWILKLPLAMTTPRLYT